MQDVSKPVVETVDNFGQLLAAAKEVVRQSGYRYGEWREVDVRAFDALRDAVAQFK